MKIQLSTPLKDLPLSPEIEKFWDDILRKKYNTPSYEYSPFSNARPLPKWKENIDCGRRVYEAFKFLADFHNLERFEFEHNGKDSNNLSSYLSMQMLEILDNNGINISKAFHATLSEDPQNTGGWSTSEVYNLYLSYLDFKKEFLPNLLLKLFIPDIEKIKQYSSHRSVDEDIATYFQLLKVIPQKDITYDWFAEHLNLFSLIEDYDSRELVNYCKYMNYDSQKTIYEYINQYFPDKVEENKQYYLNILNNNIFSIKQLYQGEIDINLIQLVHQRGLKQKNFEHLCGIAKECLNIITTSEFLNLINEDIKVSNIQTNSTSSNMVLNFSTDSYEELEVFEKIALRALRGVLSVSDKIRLSWHEDDVITNMDAKFIHQQYLYQKLNDTLDVSTPSKKKHKI